MHVNHVIPVNLHFFASHLHIFCFTPLKMIEQAELICYNEKKSKRSPEKAV